MSLVSSFALLKRNSKGKRGRRWLSSGSGLSKCGLTCKKNTEELLFGKERECHVTSCNGSLGLIHQLLVILFFR